MEGVESFGRVLLAVAVATLVAVLSNRLSERTRIPAPAFFLLVAAVASDLWPWLGRLPITAVQNAVTVALVVLLFNGGMNMGWSRFRPNAGAVAWIGVAGTFATAALLAVAAHLLGFDWRTALLLGTALAPTDPAVVFSVLGRREITGRTGVLLEGESGANDPVGIALMAGLLGSTVGSATDVTGSVAITFVEEMAVGALVGFAGGRALKVFIRKVPLPSEGLYPLRTLAGAFAVYGAATLVHGSGFLAVFVAGILLGDVRAPYKREIERFHAALSSLAEIVAFALLGLTVPLATFATQGAWADGLVLALVLVVLARPLTMALLLWPVRLRVGERVFLAFAGLKGAVPILLGSFVISAQLSHSQRVYDVVFVVVAFSVLVQGALVPAVARWCRIPMRAGELEPWALGVRLHDRPEGVHRIVVETGSAADGRTIADLDLGEHVWVSLAIREGRLLRVSGSTRLREGDEVLLLTDPEKADERTGLFRG
ncbi:cation:proton antiporter domain-containing protein [Streptomyces coelicoflavus]|uniref:cation:proton antiporter domain-containing protein n=1 Tax=Streptomyces coelicoflavus TaxID=285562 RepID=UPI0036C881ED